jgi:hypothetical protein
MPIDKSKFSKLVSEVAAVREEYRSENVRFGSVFFSRFIQAQTDWIAVPLGRSQSF